ncbi:MAG: FKBP-type peptidyl-prolyl cis-trans isomerase [Bacteroidales bacterium]
MKLVILFLITLFVLNACKNNEFKSDENGLEYKWIVSNADKRTAMPGEIMELTMYYTSPNDSILYDTREFTDVFKIKIKNASDKGGTIDDAFLLLHEGDSAIFKVDAIRFYTETKKEEVPNFIKKGDKLTFYVKVHKIYSVNEYFETKRKQQNVNEQEELAALQHYLKLSNISTTPTPSGLYYIVKKKGTGKKPTDTSIVKIDYLLSILNGEIIDNTYERNEPFEFQLGKEIVIPGLEEGIKMMREGEEATLIIPSKLAYGSQQYKIIPPYSTLVFDIKLLNVK